jgi:D-alanyl-lipoteichoic acid acyltransferase DltB (MBOAT superfamily)
MGAERQGLVTPKPKRALHQRFFPDPAAPGESEHQRQPRSDQGLYPGEPETCRRQLRPFLVTLVHLALLLAVFRVYRLEERAFQGHAFQTLVTIAVLALPLHYLSPFRWKKPLFVAVSIVGLFGVCGVLVAAVVLLLAALLIGVCSLPIPWMARVAICAALAVIMGGARSATASTTATPLIPEGIWPVFASMFMFRLIILLYELKHIKKPEKLVDVLSYFFMLPNYCFPLFPVIDYRTMQRGHFASEVHSMQRRGLQMMFRGTLHLLCYRIVYHELLIPAAGVHDPVSLLAHLVCNYLLYLQVSGQFHMACGILHLFGFQLPDTHHNYLLATSFTDYWRRINIYWKDFMVRVFFNPVVFRLKRWPQPAALAAATMVVFFATWLLHAYQSFWLRGSWGFTVPDALFWGILGFLVLVNVQLDARRGRMRLSARGPSAREPWPSVFSLLVRAGKVAGTFATVTLLWSLWNSPSLSEWVGMVHRGIYGS